MLVLERRREMNKVVSERKRRLRVDYAQCRSNGESYPTYLEDRLEACEKHRRELVMNVLAMERRMKCCSQYIGDMEQGMRIVERSVSTLKSPRDGEVVIQAVNWLQRTVRDAKDRFEHGVVS
jgi:hypothetical protein